MEAIQVDAAIGVGEFPWFGPYDNTPCNGIAVRGCTFNSCGSGVGTHTDPASQHVNITIVNSTFNDTFYACVRGQAWSGVIVANCRLNGGYHGLLFSPAAAFSCNNVALSNNSIENIGNSAYSGTQGRPISLGSVSGKVYAIVSVTGNVVRNCTGSAQYGIYFNATQKLTCLGNEVDNVNSNGVFCDGA